MRKSKEIKILLQDKVEDILTFNPDSRDSDRWLSILIWKEQIRELQVDSLDAFFHLYKSKALYSEESIGRSRRLIQERNENLRGLKYNERHSEQKEIIKLCQ